MLATTHKKLKVSDGCRVRVAALKFLDFSLELNQNFSYETSKITKTKSWPQQRLIITQFMCRTITVVVVVWFIRIRLYMCICAVH